MLKLIVLATMGGYRCAAAVLRADQQAHWSKMGNPADVMSGANKCMLAVCSFVSYCSLFGGYFPPF